MDIKDLTLGQVEEILKKYGPRNPNTGEPVLPDMSHDDHWEIGKNYFIRTVTHIDVGTLIGVTDKELILKDASWVADTGRYQQAIADGQLEEVEPYPDDEKVLVGRSALIDAVIWRHKLPRQQQ